MRPALEDDRLRAAAFAGVDRTSGEQHEVRRTTHALEREREHAPALDRGAPPPRLGLRRLRGFAPNRHVALATGSSKSCEPSKSGMGFRGGVRFGHSIERGPHERASKRALPAYRLAVTRHSGSRSRDRVISTTAQHRSGGPSLTTRAPGGLRTRTGVRLERACRSSQHNPGRSA
jgi:hypothetical protein